MRAWVTLYACVWFPLLSFQIIFRMPSCKKRRRICRLTRTSQESMAQRRSCSFFRGNRQSQENSEIQIQIILGRHCCRRCRKKCRLTCYRRCCCFGSAYANILCSCHTNSLSHAESIVFGWLIPILSASARNCNSLPQSAVCVVFLCNPAWATTRMIALSSIFGKQASVRDCAIFQVRMLMSSLWT